jgi:hypothetical protein
VKEKNGKGTGMGMLIPTWPTSTSFWNFRAALPERVKMAVPFPYMLALTSAMAASYAQGLHARAHASAPHVWSGCAAQVGRFGRLVW